MIYNFDMSQQYNTRDKLPDNRSDQEKQNSPLSVYNHNNPDISYAERMAEEIINVSGAWIIIYKRVRNSGNADKVWDEDADPVYEQAKRLKGFFEPAPADILLSKWGIDIKNETTIHFSRVSVMEMFGAKMISEGDVLIVPHNTLSPVQDNDIITGNNNKVNVFRVVKGSDTGNFNYRWMYWSVLVQTMVYDESLKIPFGANT